MSPPETISDFATPCSTVAELLVLSPRLDQPFSYACRRELMRAGCVEEGALLRVPFGKEEVLGVVWRLTRGDVSPQHYRLKSLTASMRQELPPLRAECRAFIEKFASYTMTRRGRVLKSFFSPLLHAGSLPNKKERGAYRITEKGREKYRLSSKKEKKTQSDRLLALLQESSQRSSESSKPSSKPSSKSSAESSVNPSAESSTESSVNPSAESSTDKESSHEFFGESLSREALLHEGVSSSILRRCCASGFVEEVFFSAQILPPPPALPLRVVARKLPLDEEQREAAQELCTLYAEHKFTTVLLEGETGSGKTEVYFEAVAACLQAGEQVLLMLPEIALSMRFAERFRERFAIMPLVCHSALSPRERRAVWHEVASGKVCAVLGARSALFLPFGNLGLVVVDEEHDHAYKQEEGIVYHARDMAVLRAQKADCLAVLVSATPSLESWNNAERGKYRRILLPRRFGAAKLPLVTIVDLLKESRTTKTSEPFLTPTLCARIEETLSRKEQVLIFLNRRGYAPLLLCSRCGARLSCRFCRAFLVEHRASARVACHHCDFSMPTPNRCPSCNADGSLKALGIGIERLAEALQTLFPHIRMQTISSDTENPQEVVRAFEEQRYDLVVGTQMLSKGYHFPHLTLVGIIDADLGLQGGDPRAFERCYQLLHQVAGRAGRADKKGEVVVQTTEPHSTALRALKTFDRNSFMKSEVLSRCDEKNNVFWPPFARLAAVVVSAKEERRVELFAQRLHEDFPASDGVECFGPAVPPLSPLRARHRRRFLLRTRGNALQPLLARWLARPTPVDVRLKIDIDPYNFL